MPIHWLILISVVLASLQGAIYRRFALRNLHYSRSFDTQACFEGEEIQMIEEIANDKLLPLPWLRLEALMHAGLQFRQQSNFSINGGIQVQNHKSFFSLMSYTKVIRRHQVRCLQRGCYTLQTATLTCGDLFGLRSVHTTHRFGEESRLLVYPGRVPIADIPIPFHNLQGDMEVRRWIVQDPFNIVGVREYSNGDPLNTLNWKATARSGRLQVHNRGFTSDQRLLIWLNFDISENMWDTVAHPERIEQGIRYAASLSEFAISRGIPTGFSCNGQLVGRPAEAVRLAPAGGRSHMNDIDETMAMLVIARSITFDVFLEQEVERVTADSDIVLFTSYVSSRMEQLLNRLRHNGNAVQMIILQDMDKGNAERWGDDALGWGRIADEA